MTRSAWFLGLTAAALALWLTPAGAGAQAAPDPRLEMPLYQGFIVVTTQTDARPVVRVSEPDGTVRIEARPEGDRPADGRWTVELRAPGDASAVMVRPGLRIAVTLGEDVYEVTVPQVRATADASTERVNGTVPPGSPFVYLALHRDRLCHDAGEDPPGAAYPVSTDGSFDVDVSDTMDIRVGVWGDVATVTPDGHIVISSFAPPMLVPQLVYDPGSAYWLAHAWSDPATPPTLSVINEAGLELLSAPALRSGGRQFLFVVADQGDLASGPHLLAAGQRLVLRVDGEAVVDETVPRLTASLDATRSEARGTAPRGARVRVNLRGGAASGSDAEAVAIADSEDRYVAGFPADTIADASGAEVLVCLAGSTRHLLQARPLHHEVRLFGHALSGVVEGAGAAVVEHRSPSGALVSRRTVPLDPVGAIDAKLRLPSGDRAVLAPGDTVVVRPDIGAPTTIEVPRLTAHVSADGTELAGDAPALSLLRVQAHVEAAPLYDPAPYEREHEILTARATEAGDYAAACETAECTMHYGTVRATDGNGQFTLQWQAEPRVGVGATVAQVVGEATAGLDVVVSPVDARGRPEAPRAERVLPSLSGALPRFASDLRDRYPDGMAAGDRLRIEVGERSIEVSVPRFAWAPDVVRNRVAGTAPAGTVVLVVARNDVDPSRPAAAVAQGQADASGRWLARFTGYNLVPGDALELYVPARDHYLWWLDAGVGGREPAPITTVTPDVAEPTAAPNASATPGTRSVHRIVLPRAERSR